MSGIIVYAFLGGLIWIAVRISNWLVKGRGWVLSRNQLFFLQIGIVVGFLMILFGDLVIGIFQFEYICHQRTITKLEPGWQEVQRAHSKTAYVQSVSFSAVPISCAVSEFQDKDNGKTFFLMYLVVEKEVFSSKKYWAAIFQLAIHAIQKIWIA
mgnify:CR=1 FL=1